jgi:hypothetical protein
MLLLNLIIFGFFTVWAWNTSVKAFDDGRTGWGWFSLIISAFNGASFVFELGKIT